jgi:hypothetical protein
MLLLKIAHMQCALKISRQSGDVTESEFKTSPSLCNGHGTTFFPEFQIAEHKVTKKTYFRI